MPRLVAGLPSTAARMPRLLLTSSDSCGLSMAGEVSVAVCTGLRGSVMSRAITPRPSTALKSTSRGKSRVES